MADWKTTSEAGFEFEDFCLVDITKKINPIAYKNMIKENYSYYDIILFNGKFNEKQKTVECKFDEKAHETGNICIEVGCNGRLSGLSITTADFWLIGDGYEMFLIKREDISRCIYENPDIRYYKKCPVTQEDGVVKIMNFYLITKNLFKKYCLEATGINEMTYEKMI
jgi:hypothetical protein